jgi:predicted sugar kinase
VATKRSAPSETLTGTLLERVDKLVQAHKPLLSTAPLSDAVGELVLRIDALEKAVREIAHEVQKLSANG